MFRPLRYSWLGVALAAALVAAFAGCSDDPVTTTDPGDSGQIQASVDPAAGSFEITVPSAGDPARPLAGPFVIRGRNIHYDDAAGALVADLSVLNHSRTSIPEPIGLTFLDLMPDGVEVQNPDNDIHGDGAAIVFAFDNDDGMWTPGEESLPHAVQFSAERGQAVAFVARIDVGEVPTDDGAIGGIVWRDTDGDGVLDPGEAGIPRVEIFMTRGDAEATTTPEALYRTITGADGHYAFKGLPAGFYTLARGGDDQCMPTTSSIIHVLLTESDDGVSRYLDANFGCALPEPPPPPDSLFVQVGDWINARGQYQGTPMGPYPPGLAARIVSVTRCTDFRNPCEGLQTVLAGPVTGINVDRRAIEVMNTWLHVPPDDLETTVVRLTIPLDKIQVGDRVRAEVAFLPDGQGPVAWNLAWWNEDEDVVMGFVDRVMTVPERPLFPIAVGVLGTRVDLTHLTAVDSGDTP